MFINDSLHPLHPHVPLWDRGAWETGWFTLFSNFQFCNLFCPFGGFSHVWLLSLAPPCCMTAKNEAWVADCMTPKPQDPRIYRSYSAQICAPSCPSGGGKGLSRPALFCSGSLRPLCLFQRLLLRVTWPSRFRIVQKTETLPSGLKLRFSRNLQHQRRSAAAAHGESPRRVHTQCGRISADYAP